MNKTPIIQAKDISKTFGATKALRGVDFDFYEGEIFSIVGANGAGKSTFIKILCGYYSDYEGKIYIDGELVRFESPRDAYDAGIQVVHQDIEQGIVQNMSIGENLALDMVLSPEASVIYDKKAILKRAKEIAKKMNLLYLDMEKNITEVSQSEKQMIIIARALAKKPKLLILDEPTSSISNREASMLFKTLFKLKEEGVSILYVSHYLTEVKEISDRVGVIRDGQNGGILHKPLQVPLIVKAMVGDMQSEITMQKGNIKKHEILFRVKDLLVEGGKNFINLTLFKGEIVGLLGLVGAGKSEFAEALFGLREHIGGEIEIDGKNVEISSIKDAMKNGIRFVPENRSVNAIIPEESIKNNITLPFLDFFSRLGVVLTKKEIEYSENMINNMSIKCEGYDAYIESLSGGNQQKVIVARWLLMDYNIAILDEPFQGVDIKSRRDISLFLRENIKDRAILMISSDIDELMDVADRIVVMNRGKIIYQEKSSKVDRDMLLNLMSQED